MDRIILVDSRDRQTGTEEKLKAHKEGSLHRAFSIFIFNRKGELMLQRRAKGKYHSGGLWTNTCCSHPRAGENLEKAVHRRLKEEMGFDTALKELFSFTYKATFRNGLTEHELDHVFVGRFDGAPAPNPEEYDEWKWISLEQLKKDIAKDPDGYTYWLRACLDTLTSKMRSS